MLCVTRQTQKAEGFKAARTRGMEGKLASPLSPEWNLLISASVSGPLLKTEDSRSCTCTRARALSGQPVPESARSASALASLHATWQPSAGHAYVVRARALLLPMQVQSTLVENLQHRAQPNHCPALMEGAKANQSGPPSARPTVANT